MRHRLLVQFIGIGVAFGVSFGVVSAQTAPAEREVMQAIDQVNAAFQNRDVKAYEALTTADFVRVTSAGRVHGRSDWVKNVVALPGAARVAGKYDQVSVRVYGNGAVVTYRNVPATTGSQPGVVSYLTRIMEKQGTQWKMALAQSTDLKTPSPPTGTEPPALPPWSATTAAEKAALSAFQAIQKANAARDLAAWEKLSAADHAIIGADGTRTTRAERVANLKAPATGQAGPAGPDQQVRVMVKGDLAAVTWLSDSTRGLKVLALKGGAWQQVLQQSSPIVAAKK
jgi:ketosteroid isomerase-like protein